MLSTSSNMQLILICLCLVLGFSGSLARRVNTTLTVANGGGWGYWRNQVFCPEGTHAVGYNLEIERPRRFGDDTSLNNIALLCKGKSGESWEKRVTGYVPGPEFGDWRGDIECAEAEEFLTAFKLKVESPQGSGDDTAANMVNFKCRSTDTTSGSYSLTYKLDGYWGSWGQWSGECPVGTAICGVQAKTEEWRLFNDDTALNDARFFCCE